MNRLKHYYTADVGRPLRWLTIVALALVTLFMAACAACNIIMLWIGGELHHPLKWVLWGTAFSIVVSLVCGWMLIRLVRGVRAGNGKTVMPVWFIQSFGVLLFLFLLLVAITDQRPWRFVEAVSVATAMISIRWLLRTTGPLEGE